MADVLVPEVVLDRSGVVAIIGELVAAGVSEHVRMDRESQLSFLARPFHDMTNGRRCEGPFPFCTKDVGAVRILTSKSPQGAKLRPT